MLLLKEKLSLLCLILFLVICIVIFSGSVSALEGYISKVDLEQNAIKVKNNWYFLQENTIIERNNTIGSLKSCKPVAGNKQWAQLEFSNSGELTKIIVNYYIVEGIVKEILTEDKKITISIFQDSGSLTGEQTFSFDSEIKYKLNGFTEGDHIVLITNLDRLLQIKISHSEK